MKLRSTADFAELEQNVVGFTDLRILSQSRWQSWMRMLAVGIRAVDEPARSIGFTKCGVSDGSASVAATRISADALVRRIYVLRRLIVVRPQ